MTIAADPARRPRVIDEELRVTLRAELLPQFRGTLIGPTCAEYHRARAVWNAMVDKRPGLIARCADTRDVVAAVNAARRHHLVLAVRGGGHSVAGNAQSDGGLTIDLGGLRSVEVDARRRLVHAGGGCLLADVDEATAEHGLIVPAGIVSDTGLGGLALGGGVGWFTRKHGLTCDNFVSLEVVLANGQVVEASPDHHPDLFWALRGGGGNFGVVTRFTLRAHRFGPMMRIGVALYRPQVAEQALREYARLLPALPRTVGWHAALKRRMPALPFVPANHIGARLLMLLAMWLDDADDRQGAAQIQRLTTVGDPCFSTMAVLPFGHGLQKSLDPEFSAGHRNYTKETHLRGLPDGVISTVVDFWADMPMDGEVEIISVGGGITDTPEDRAAFANRHYPWWLNFALRWDDPRRDADYIARIRKAAHDVGPFAGPGVYVNALNTDELNRVVDAYGGPENYTRLGRIKATYDPENLFRINANITPVSNCRSYRKTH